VTPPTLNERCTSPLDGCELLSLAAWAVDWTHTNTISYVPRGRNLLLSVRNQDCVLKIDYRDGQGSGDVIWALGHGGDFTLADGAGEVLPWFSHQHDVSLDGDSVVLYDNGNVRHALKFFRRQPWPGSTNQ